MLAVLHRIPLTCEEWEEWGNPNEAKYHNYMMSYSPIQQVRPEATVVAYPAVPMPMPTPTHSHTADTSSGSSGGGSADVNCDCDCACDCDRDVL